MQNISERYRSGRKVKFAKLTRARGELIAGNVWNRNQQSNRSVNEKNCSLGIQTDFIDICEKSTQTDSISLRPQIGSLSFKQVEKEKIKIKLLEKIKVIPFQTNIIKIQFKGLEKIENLTQIKLLDELEIPLNVLLTSGTRNWIKFEEQVHGYPILIELLN